jgi:hypothetical protein
VTARLTESDALYVRDRLLRPRGPRLGPPGPLGRKPPHCATKALGVLEVWKARQMVARRHEYSTRFLSTVARSLGSVDCEWGLAILGQSSGKLRPDEIAAQVKVHPPEGHILTTSLDGLRERRIHAIEFVLLPPFGLLVFGYASIWVAGFD